MLDGLVGRPVLSHTNRIVSPNVYRRQVAQRREAHGGAHVVGKAEERRSVATNASVVADAVHDPRPSRAPAHRSGDCGPSPSDRRTFHPLESGLRRGRKICVPSDELGEPPRRWRSGLFPTPLGSSFFPRLETWERLVPTRRQRALEAALPFGCEYPDAASRAGRTSRSTPPRGPRLVRLRFETARAPLRAHETAFRSSNRASSW